jgi:hypothetical protein
MLLVLLLSQTPQYLFSKVTAQLFAGRHEQKGRLFTKIARPQVPSSRSCVFFTASSRGSP